MRLPAKPAIPAKEDYEYERAGTCNIFVAVEPRGQRRFAQVTARRTKVDFVAFVCRMLRSGYSRVRKVHLVLDNLNTHVRESFDEVLGVTTAATLLRRIEFHYRPKHASWLNMAEIEIGVLQRQCLARCAAEHTILATEVAAWQRRRNAARCSRFRHFGRRCGALDAYCGRISACTFSEHTEALRQSVVVLRGPRECINPASSYRNRLFSKRGHP